MRLRKGDFLLAALLLGLAGLLSWTMTGAASGPLVAVIEQDGETVRRIEISALADPIEVELAGEYHLTIRAENGRIRFLDADCPDRLCVHTGWLTRKGQTAVCLPGRTLVRIEGGSDQMDAVSG